MSRRTTLGCLAAFVIFVCLLPAGAICAASNVGAYYLLRKPATLRDPVQIERAMDTIEMEVRALRGVSDPAPVKRTVITPAELRARITAEFKKSYTPEQAQGDLEEYAAFGLLAPTYDLYSFYLNTYSTLVLGYYDPEAKELFVVSGEGFGASERSTFAHEYLHSLQFQRPNLTADKWDSGANSDIASAKQSLVEGEATFVEQMWQKRYFSLGDQFDYYKQSLAALNLDYFRIPVFLAREVDFPYLEGSSFIAALYAEGGWSAVDAAFRDPPASTEMILHPEIYLLGGQPVRVAAPVLPPALAASWREVHSDAMGEFITELILANQVSAAQASKAAAGWGGDQFVVWRNDASASTAVAWHTRWDAPADADEFASALNAYDGARFGKSVPEAGAVCWIGALTACQTQSGSDVWWFYGPDRRTVQSLMESNPGGSAAFASDFAFPSPLFFR